MIMRKYSRELTVAAALGILMLALGVAAPDFFEFFPSFLLSVESETITRSRLFYT